MAGFLGGLVGGASINIVIRAVDKFSKTFGIANAGLLKLGGAITGIGVAGAFAVGGLIKMAGKFEQTQIAFTTMLGSAEEADKMLKELADFAAKTPFTIPGIEQNAKMLLAMSIETEKILPTLKSLGDIASGLNVPMERLALNFGQVKVQGKLTGRELRDFAVAGVPLIAELAKNLNKSEAEIKDMVSAGKIGFAEVEQAFTTMTSEGGKFFDLMDAQSKTLLGQISNIQDSFIKLSRVMGKVFLPAAKFVAEHLAVLVGWFEEHPKLARFAAVVFGVGVALALIIGPLLIIVATMPFLIAQMTALSIVGLPVWAVALAISAIFLALIGIIVGVIAIYKLLKENWTEFVVGMGGLFLKFNKFMLNFLFGAKLMWAKVWNGIINIVLSAWNIIVKGIENSINGIIKLINLLIDQLNRLPFVNIKKIQEVNLSGFQSTLRDVDAIVSGIEKERDLMKDKLDLQYQELVNNAAKIKLAKENTEEATKQTDELTKQKEIVSKLNGMKVLYSKDPATGEIKFGDVFNPKAFSTDEFQSRDAYIQAALGAGMTINIENINGIDPDEIAEALNDKLKTMISI